VSGRAQKYERRERVLYALVFKKEWKGRVYIGQTIDANRRAKQHGRAWPVPFDFVELGRMTGTQSDGEDFEYAWRLRAGLAGCVVVAQTWAGETFVVSDTGARMTDERWAIAGRLKWPRELRQRAPWAWLWNWIAWQGGALAGVVMGLRVW
jgi:hypothetical protein